VLDCIPGGGAHSAAQVTRALIYVGSVVLIFVGAFAGIVVLSIVAAGVLFVYSLTRTLTPPTAQ
jgi:hypothetical protein